MGVKTLSIIVPVYNEEKTLKQVLSKVIALDLANIRKEIIVVDDGSTDSTGDILKNFIGKLVIVSLPRNSGKGSAVRAGLAKAGGDYVLLQDADLEYDPQDIAKLVKIVKTKDDVVYGSRNIHPKRRGYPHYVWGVAFLTWCVNTLFGSSLTDVYTCYKLIPRKLMGSLGLVSGGFELEAEITAKLLKRGVTINEVPVSYKPRKFSEGKKIRFVDGVRGLFVIANEKLGGSND